MMDVIQKHVKSILETAKADNRPAEISVKVGNGNLDFISADVHSSGGVSKIAVGIAVALYRIALCAIKYGGFTEEAEKEAVLMILGETITELAMNIYATDKEAEQDD